MGLGRIFGGIRKFIQGAGRLVRKIVNPAKKIFGKVSPYVKKGIEIISKVPQTIQTVRDKKQQITDKIDQIVDMVPDSKFKQKIKGAIDRGKQVADRVIDKAQLISDKTQPYIQAGQKIYDKIKPAVITPKKHVM